MKIRVFCPARQPGSFDDLRHGIRVLAWNPHHQLGDLDDPPEERA
jgi:hypothetical protein